MVLGQCMKHLDCLGMNKYWSIAKKVETEKEYENAISIRRKVFVEEQDVPIHLELDEYDESSTFHCL